MPPSPIPAPLPPWARAVLQLAPLVGGYLYELLTHANPAPSVMQWRRLQVKCQCTAPAAVTSDDAYVSWDLVNITGGNVDNSWTTSDYTTCEALFDTFFNSYKTYLCNYGTIKEYRWYTREFNDLSLSKAFKDSGPPQRVTAKTIVGAASANSPQQLSCTVTEKTAWPKHWGRIYLPFTGAGFITSGRWSSTAVDAIATAAQTLYSGLATAEFFPVIPVTQIDKAPARALLTTTQVAVDDVPDIVRRRRPRNVVYRKTLP